MWEEIRQAYGMLFPNWSSDKLVEEMKEFHFSIKLAPTAMTLKLFSIAVRDISCDHSAHPSAVDAFSD